MLRGSYQIAGSASLPKVYVHPGAGMELTITDSLMFFLSLPPIFLSSSSATLFPTSVLLHETSSPLLPHVASIHTSYAVKRDPRTDSSWCCRGAFPTSHQETRTSIYFARGHSEKFILCMLNPAHKTTYLVIWLSLAPNFAHFIQLVIRTWPGLQLYSFLRTRALLHCAYRRSIPSMLSPC